MRVAQAIVLSDEERAELSSLVRSKLTSVRLAQRAQIVLLASESNPLVNGLLVCTAHESHQSVDH